MSSLSFATVFNKILNICEHEWPRLKTAWLLTFFYKTSLVIGWTILVASFVSRMGITNLPYLFIAHAVLIITGSILFFELIQYIKKDTIILSISFLTGITLVIATFFANNNDLFFFAFLLIASSLLLSQMGILISMFNEDLFSPLESQRAFPIIESAETIGGITAGILINRLANIVPSYGLIYIWLLLISSSIPLVILYYRNKRKLPHIEIKKTEIPRFHIRKLREYITMCQKIPYLKGLLIIIILQWIFINLFEFQYTNAINQHVLEREQTLKIQSDEIIADKTLKLHRGTKISSYEQDLTYDLGSLHIIFNTSSLLVQLFFVSRILGSIGTMSSMSINPLVMFMASTMLLIRYNLLSAIIAKTSHELSYVLFKNPYHTSFYALKKEYRNQAKEFLEGIAKPFGSIIGTIIIIVFQQIYLPENLIFVINLSMVGLCALLLIQLYANQQKFTSLAIENLNTAQNNHAKMYALELLSQKGHKNTAHIFTDILRNPQEDKELKIKALESLGILQDVNAIHDILQCLENADHTIKHAALETLAKYHILDEYAEENAFAMYRILSCLKSLFQKENDTETRSQIINTITRFNNTEAVSFLIKTLRQSSDRQIQSSCIAACAQFKDPNCAYYILPFLNSPDLHLRSRAMIALGQFSQFREQIKNAVNMLLEKYETLESRLMIADLIGGLKLHKEKNLLKNWLKEENHQLKCRSAINLALLDDKSGLEYLAEKLLRNENDCTEKIENEIKNFHPDIQKELNDLLQSSVARWIENLLQNANQECRSLNKSEQKKLERVYKLVRAYEEYNDLENIFAASKIPKFKS